VVQEHPCFYAKLASESTVLFLTRWHLTSPFLRIIVRDM